MDWIRNLRNQSDDNDDLAYQQEIRDLSEYLTKNRMEFIFLKVIGHENR